MSDDTTKRYRLVNQTGQPIELHTRDTVIVLEPHHEVEVGGDAVALPQIAHLLQGHTVIAQEIGGAAPPAPAERPARTKAASARNRRTSGR